LACLPIFSQIPPSTNGAEVGVGELVGVEVGIGVVEGVGEDIGVGDTVGTGLMTVTPLFQTNFLPLLMHVYFLPSDVEVAPSFVQLPPAFTAASALNCPRKIKLATSATNNFLDTFTFLP
jgi:hypothetical protein